VIRKVKCAHEDDISKCEPCFSEFTGGDTNTGDTLEQTIDEFVSNLPIKATEIGYEKIGEDVQDLVAEILKTHVPIDLVREILGDDENTHPEWCGVYEQASERVVCSCGLYSRNELRSELRAKLNALVEKGRV